MEMKKILSVEGSSLYEANEVQGISFNSTEYTYKNKDGEEVKRKRKLWTGTLPYSLESIKLDSLGDVKDKSKTKQIVNVTFKTKYRGGNQLEDKSINQLKDYLYVNGFDLDGKHYVLYKRSSSKSRTGSVLFIRNSIFPQMRTWSWLGLKPLDDNKNYDDIASFKAYESLSISSLESTIQVNSDSILIVNDLKSTFEAVASVTRMVKGELETKTEEEYVMENNIFDGESLIQSDLIPHSMVLLRARWLKSCAFSCNIQKFYKAHFKADYDTTMVEDMFGNKMLAKDVKLIMCPSSLKFLKLADVKFNGSKKDAYDYWRSHVGDLWGVCKHDKPSKTGTYQRTSYQMLQGIDLNLEELKELIADEVEYTMNIKNNIAYFKNHISLNDSSPSRQAILDILNINKDFQYTQTFKTFKDNEINKSYIGNLKKGKIKVNGSDYYTICGNPWELLLSSIRLFKEGDKPITLKDNEIYCKRYGKGTELCGFRNPSINQGNVIYLKSVCNNVIDKYFNFDGNIVVVNSINFDIQQRLQGQDLDSDSVILFSEKTIVAKAIDNQKYPTPVCEIDRENTPRQWNNESFAKVDELIADNCIGEIINLSMRIQSMYWHELHTKNRKEVLDELYRYSSQLSSLSQLEIDKAKKMFELDIKKQLRRIEKEDCIVKVKGKAQNPMFFKNLGKSNCVMTASSMDYLQVSLKQSIKKADSNTKNEEGLKVNFYDILVIDKVKGIADYKQVKNIIKIIEKYDMKFKKYQAQKQNSNDEIKLKTIKKQIETLQENTVTQLRILKIKKETILVILRTLELERSDIAVNFLSMIYSLDKKLLLSCFKGRTPLFETLVKADGGEIDIWGIKYKRI